jgi:hypothetical protein
VNWIPVVAGAALCVAGWADSGPASTPSQLDAAGPMPCRPSQLKIGSGARVSPATGQNPLSIVLTNRSAKPCVVDGYPAITFVDAHGKRLPFRVSHSGDQMITSRAPVAVRALSRRVVYFVLNKYRCDLGNLQVAKKLHVALPRRRTSAHLAVAIPTHPVIAYCGRNDAGSVVAVSPFVATLAAALARR